MAFRIDQEFPQNGLALRSVCSCIELTEKVFLCSPLSYWFTEFRLWGVGKSLILRRGIVILWGNPPEPVMFATVAKWAAWKPFFGTLSRPRFANEATTFSEMARAFAVDSSLKFWPRNWNLGAIIILNRIGCRICVLVVRWVVVNFSYYYNVGVADFDRAGECIVGFNVSVFVLRRVISCQHWWSRQSRWNQEKKPCRPILWQLLVIRNETFVEWSPRFAFASLLAGNRGIGYPGCQRFLALGSQQLAARGWGLGWAEAGWGRGGPASTQPLAATATVVDAESEEPLAPRGVGIGYTF